MKQKAMFVLKSTMWNTKKLQFVQLKDWNNTSKMFKILIFNHEWHSNKNVWITSRQKMCDSKIHMSPFTVIWISAFVFLWHAGNAYSLTWMTIHELNSQTTLSRKSNQMLIQNSSNPTNVAHSTIKNTSKQIFSII